MHITRYTDYSLRVLIYVALKKNTLCTIQEIADAYNISKNHLMKVVQELNNKGYLQAIRGKNGGLRLHGTPADINIGELIRTTEQDFALVECLSGHNHCVITPACKLKNVLNDAVNAFLKTLDQYTLADILPERNRKGLLELLDISS